jgi:hypothetical protein
MKQNRGARLAEADCDDATNERATMPAITTNDIATVRDRRPMFFMRTPLKNFPFVTRFQGA